MWKNIDINNNTYMIDVLQTENTIKVFLTNLVEIWMETLTNEIILDRCQKLNPLLSVEALNCTEIVLHILDDIPKHIFSASLEQITLRAQIDGGSMKFTLYLTKGKPQDFWETITKPLCISLMEINRQHEFLLDLVKKKDVEIAEYKAEGAELIRKNIETKTFTEEQLKVDIPAPNIIDYTNAFRMMMNFYTKFDLCKQIIGASNPLSLSTPKEIILQAEQNIITPGRNINESIPENVTSEDNSIQNKIESSQKIIRKDGNKKKSRSASMAYRPVKKLKNGLKDSIL